MRTMFVLLITFLASCSNDGKNSLTSSDSLSIQFKSIASGAVVKTIGTRDAKAIEKMANFLDGASSENYKCGYGGTMMFYTKGLLTGYISFNYSTEGCHHFLETKGDTLKSTKMSDEAASFLQSPAQGKSWY